MRLLPLLCLLLSFALPAHAKVPPKNKRGPRDMLLVAGGDVAYPRGWMDALVERRKEAMFEQVRGFAKAAELAFVNLESPYSDKAFKIRKTYQVVTPPHRLDYVLSGGFNLFSLANNHMADAGEEGIADTLALLEKKREGNKHLWWAGAGRTVKEAWKPRVFTVPGKKLKVAFHAFGYAGSKLVPVPSEAQAIELVTTWSKKVDISIVSIHHGTEYRHVPAKEKAAMYRRFVEAGADVLLGHHPHVVQGVERYKNGIIFHSLGNFSFASKTVRHKKTGAKLYSMLPLVYIKDAKVERVEIVPLYANNAESWKLNGKTLRPVDFTPQVLHGDFATAMLSELKEWTDQIPGIASEAAAALTIQGERGVVQVRK